MKRLLVFIVALVMLLQMTAYAAHSFKDVDADSWYSDAVDYVYNKGLMSGTAYDRFSPDVNMSRAMLVTVLYSMEGKPFSEARNPFEDVDSSDWFHRAVIWAYENGIVAGTSQDSFSPNMNITREQMVAIFSKYVAFKGLSTSATADIGGYRDCDDISSYAVDAFRWAVQIGIVSGTSTDTLSPCGEANRAQCAVILRSLEMWMVKQESGDDQLPDIDNGMGWA